MTVSSSVVRRRPGGDVFVVRHALSSERFVAALLLAAIVLIATSVVAWDGTVPAWEADLFRFVNDGPDWLEPIVWPIQQLGVLGAPVIGGLFIAWSTRRWRHAVPFLLLVPLKLTVEWLFLKQVVERERPFLTIGDDVNLRGAPVHGLGFPSGHATTAFAFAVLVVAFLPVRWRPVPFALAVLVGIARLYAGAHNVLDVVAGAAVGTIFGLVLWQAVLNRVVESPGEPS